jgi:glutamate-1-semialdehyde aminotransferase/acyl carrier protein
MSESTRARVVSMLQALLGQMLGVNPDEVDVRATFPEMGADSLFLLEASHSIRDKFGVKVPFRAMLHEYSTIQMLAGFIVNSLPAEEIRSAETIQAMPAPPVSTPSAPEAEPQPPATSSPESVVHIPSVESSPIVKSESALERLLTQQMKLMSQQLALLQEARQPKNTTAVTRAPEIVPAKQNGTNHSNGTKAESNGRKPAPVQEIEKEFVPKSYVALQPVKKDPDGLTPRQRKHVDELIVRLTKRTQGSKQLTAEYRPVLANNRASAGFRSTWKEILYPLHTVSASGARVKDVDGNEYVDLVMGFGALLFGHSPSFLVEAMQEQIANGLQLGAESHLAGKVAALICELTGMERVGFCNSGTEAVMSALRMARMVTGRSKIALFEGNYHGTFDGIQVRPGSKEYEALPLTSGTTINMVQDVLVLKWDDAESLKAIEEHGHELAAVLLEPLPSRRPDLQPKAFLHELRRITKQFGITLIFDEVVTGFRLHPGGAQALYDVRADLVTYGKAIGGGLPVSIVAGKAEYLDTVDGGDWNYGDASYPRAEMTLVTGTFFRHPVLMPVVYNVLQEIKRGGVKLYQELEQRAASLAATLNAYFEEEAVPIRMMQVQSMLRFVPHRDVKFMPLFYYHLLEHGVYVSETRSCFISTAHTDEDFAHIVNAVKRSVAAMREGELLPSITPSGGPRQPVRTFPLTEAQQAIWALTRLGEDASRAYHESSTMDVRGPFDVPAIRHALQELVGRHEALRIVFGPEGDFQHVQPELNLDVPLIDFSHLDPHAREAQTKDWLTGEVQRSFDLTRGPLIRAAIVKLEEQHHLLVLTIHHIVSDGWSNGILQGELAALYAAASQGIAHNLPEPAQFSEYVLAQTDGSAEFSRAESYWLDKYGDSVPVLELPTDKPRPAEQTFAGHRQMMTLDTSTYMDLKRFSAQQDATLFTTLLAAFNVLLHHVTKQSDLVVGIHAAGQLTMGGGNIIGHCVNLLPLRSQVTGNPTFASYLADVKRMTMEAYEHQTYPMLRLIKKLNLRRDPSRMPLVAIVFNLDKMSAEAASNALPSETQVTASSNAPSFLQWELSLNVIEANNKLLVGCDHKTDLFEAETVRRWMSWFETVLRTVMDQPEISLESISEALETQDRELLDLARVQKFQSIKRRPVYA